MSAAPVFQVVTIDCEKAGLIGGPFTVVALAAAWCTWIAVEIWQ